MNITLFAQIIQKINKDSFKKLVSKHDSDKPEYYSRIKKEVKAILSSSKHTKQDELITELNKKIKASKTHYR